MSVGSSLPSLVRAKSDLGRWLGGEGERELEGGEVESVELALSVPSVWRVGRSKRLGRCSVYSRGPSPRVI